MDTTLPSGYMFNPTDQQLVYDYLYKKANGRPLPCGAIKECDIYGDVSSWRNMFMDTEEESLHFFNRLNQKSGSSSRVGRATEFGTWKCQSDTKIYAAHLHIGSKRTFSFIEKKSKEDARKNKGERKAPTPVITIALSSLARPPGAFISRQERILLHGLSNCGSTFSCHSKWNLHRGCAGWLAFHHEPNPNPPKPLSLSRILGFLIVCTYGYS